jgi:hypothetical protein
VANSSLRDRSYNEHDTGSVKTDNLNKAPLSTAESSGQTLASVTVSVSSLPNIGEDDPVIIDILCFTTAKILDKRSSPFEVELQVRVRAGVVILSLGEAPQRS